MRISKKILAAVLAALMVIAAMPFTALAETIGIAPSPSTIEIDIDEYDTIFDAIEDADQGAVLVFTEDIVVTKPVVINAGKVIKFNLNGHSLSGNIQDTDGKKLIQVSGELEFVGNNGGYVYNTNTAGQGHAACQALSGGIIFVNAPVHFGDADSDMTNANTTNRGCGIQNNGGTLIINDGYYTAIDANYSTGAWAYAILNCEGDTIVNDATVYGNGLHGALGCEEGTLTVNGGTFAVNGANNYYSLYCDGGTITVNNGTFTDNSKFGVNYVGTDSATYINGGEFTYASTTPFVQSSSKANPVVSGGTYSGDVTAYLDESCDQNAGGTVVQAYVAKVGSTKYATLEDAIAAASEGDTITLLADLDFTCYPRATKHVINLTGKTLDLNGNTVTTYNHSVVFVGDNFTIKNGSFVCETDPNFTDWNPNNAYSVVIYPEDYNSVNDDVYDYSTGVVLENLNLVGGVNCYGSVVTLREVNASATYLNVKGTTYYAVWADTHTTVTVESGTYSSDSTSANAVVACNKNDASSTLTITGGNFTVKSGQNLTLTGNRLLSISGGTFNTDVSNYLADGYTVNGPVDGWYTVYPAGEDTMSIVVADNIDLNINLDTTDDRAETVEYTFSDPYSEGGETTTVTTSAKNDVTSFTVALSPAQVMDDITAVVKDENGDVVREVTTSIADYCNAIIESETTEVITEELKNLAKSTLDYGKAASDYFNYNEEAAWAENNYLTDPSDAIADLANDAPNAWYDTNVMRITGMTYRATSTPELRFYIDANIREQNAYSGEDAALECNFGKARFVKNEAGEAMLQITDIDIVDFNKEIVVSWKSTGYEILRITPIIWVKAAINSSDDEMCNLGKAIGNYYLKSVAYFGE